MERSDLHIGQEVIVRDYRGEATRGTITKIGRTLVTITWGGWGTSQFRIETGAENGEHGGYSFRTKEQEALDERESAAWAYLKDAGLVRPYGASRLTLAQLEAAVVAIEAHKPTGDNPG